MIFRLLRQSPRPAVSRSESGVAIVIVLAVLVLMSIMVISLHNTMRVERGSSRSHMERARAEMLAQTGVEEVIARLRQVTGDPNRAWISGPGRLVAAAAGGASTVLLAPPIPLHSGTAGALVPSKPYFKPAELNIRAFEAAGNGAIAPHLITSLPDPNDPTIAVRMPVKWIYLRQDGTKETADEPDTTVRTNPIVGRYAYWTDDESSKINYNLAWTRGSDNPNPPGHPTKINLPALFTSGTDAAEMAASENFATAIHLYSPSPSPSVQPIPPNVADYRALTRFFFNTPEDARKVDQVAPGVSEVLDTQRFSLTHYNHDPDTTFFNEPRIVLTTRKSRAGNRPFLDIAVAGHEEDDLGNYVTDSHAANVGFPIDPGKLDATLKLLNRYLSRTDWPIAPGSSFQKKYYEGEPDRLTQLSLDIIDYVRCKESVAPMVIPLRGSTKTGKFVLGPANDNQAYISIARGPRITEMGLYVSGTSVVPEKPQEYNAKFKIEIFAPKAFGLSGFDPRQLDYYVGFSPGQIEVPGMASGYPSVQLPVFSAPIVSADGTRWVVTWNARFKYLTARPPDGDDITLRVALSPLPEYGGEYNDRLEVIPLQADAAYRLKCKGNAASVSEADMPSIQVDDPRVDMNPADWIQVSRNTFGAANSVSSIGSPSTVLPEQDADKDGNITGISLVIPAPSGTTDGTLASNPYGIVTSVGELGFICTGRKSTMAGIPWRTLRLQPGRQDASVVPDWALMDLFTVPAGIPPHVPGKTDPASIYSPHGTTTGGRVNLNARPEPFNLDRTDPLAAVFQGARREATSTATLSPGEARTIALNVYNRTLATHPAGHQYGYQLGYDSPGEIVEMKGVADGGEESEQLVREISNLVTARGGVFSIYTVGQAIRQTPDGRLVVTGEQRQQAMVERYSGTDGKVHFRNVYFRNLIP